ncbi:MAG TPA: cache domain-containing protein, partial [Burkholderiaceae bacterium]
MRAFPLPALPGAPWVRLLLVGALAALLSAALAAGWVAREARNDATQRLARQQAGEVEVVASMLAGRLEQSQKVLRALAAGIMPDMLDSASSLEYLLRDQPSAVQFFDTILVARADGLVRVNFQRGKFLPAAALSPAARDYLRRTLVQGKPGITELLEDRPGEPMLLFTMPLRGAGGQLTGVVAGGLKLQPQGLLPQAMALPVRPGASLIVVAADGTILAHPHSARVLGSVRDEPGVAPLYANWVRDGAQVVVESSTSLSADFMVSTAGMPLPQWMVVCVTPVAKLFEPLRDNERRAWVWAGGGVLLCAMVVGLLVLGRAGSLPVEGLDKILPVIPLGGSHETPEVQQMRAIL